MTENATDEDFEFECPQFQDFTSTLDEISEEQCQNFFDRKTEELRNSNEFIPPKKTNCNTPTKHIPNPENQAPPNEHQEPIKHSSTATTATTNSSSDCDMSVDTNTNPQNGDSVDVADINALEPISNLLSVTEFANTSMASTKSTISSSNSSHHKSSYMNPQKSASILSTEQRELQKLQKQKEALNELKQKNAKNVMKMREKHHVFHPTRSTKLTIPITPSLHTTARAQQRMGGSQSDDILGEISDKKKTAKKLAQKKKKRKSSQTSTTTTTMSASAATVNDENVRPNATIPQSFKLLSKTRQRCKSSTLLSTEQKQLKEIEEYKGFKATKVNRKIFENNASNIGILNNIKNKPTTTTTQPFKFLTEKRAKKYYETHVNPK